MTSGSDNLVASSVFPCIPLHMFYYLWFGRHFTYAEPLGRVSLSNLVQTIILGMLASLLLFASAVTHELVHTLCLFC
jgi:RsiW-degrading membrane proteinase PrsW (M82 family)